MLVKYSSNDITEECGDVYIDEWVTKTIIGKDGDIEEVDEHLGKRKISTVSISKLLLIMIPIGLYLVLRLLIFALEHLLGDFYPPDPVKHTSVL